MHPVAQKFLDEYQDEATAMEAMGHHIWRLENYAASPGYNRWRPVQPTSPPKPHVDAIDGGYPDPSATGSAAR